MKTLRKILIWLFSIIAVIVIVGLFIPGKVHVERSAAMNAPAQKVFPLVADMHNWPSWSPWHKMDPNMTVTYFGPQMGLGAGYAWTSEKMGNGKLTIKGYEENKALVTEMDFMENGIATGGFNFTPEGSGTKVTWYMDSDVKQGNVFMRALGGYFGLMFKGMIADDFDKGLADMKKEAEK